MLPKSLGQHERETAEQEYRELFEIVHDFSDLADLAERLCNRYGAQINGCKIEEVSEYLNEWVARWEDQLLELGRVARGLPG